MVRRDPGAVAKRDGALDGGSELSDISGPVVLLQDFEGIAGEAGDRLVEFAGIVISE